MQNLSFDPRDPFFTFNGLTFAVQLFTFENVYGLDPARCQVRTDERGFDLVCDGLTWAGGQEKCGGAITIQVTISGDRTLFRLSGTHTQAIRCIKLVLRGIPDGEIVNLREAERRTIPDGGLLLRYPDGWRGLYTPLIMLRGADGQHFHARSLDTRVREKRFALLRHDGRLDLELIVEALATEADAHFDVPTWEIGFCADPERIYREHAAHLEQAANLPAWENRPDVPAWAREIGLIIAIHMQHNTGYIFNDYAKALETVRWFADRVDAQRLLFYLPGWEGRYYWQYGDYRPDPRMGGEAGFEALVHATMDLGAHVMPMFGINVVNSGLPNYEVWGAPAERRTVGGAAGGGGTVDWDSARHHDHHWGVLLNPGAPTWQNRLVSQIRTLQARYGFDGVFLDISAGWWNDPRFPVFEGTRQLVARIREGVPQVLVAGEGWYDFMGAVTPLVQSGATDGMMHYHDMPYAGFFTPYARCFAHLMLGDPGRGSSGVHEWGISADRATPDRPGVIPTITVVDDTLEVAGAELEAALAHARRPETP